MIVFSIKGVRVRLHPSILIMMALTALLNGVGTVAVVFASVAFHEAGHAIAAKLSGAKLSEIELMPFGAAARIDDMQSLRLSKAMLVALSGPGASFCLCFVSTFFHGEAARLFQNVNMAIAAFNLLPALPLDGGRVFCRLLSCRVGIKRATGVCIGLGHTVAALILALSILLYMSAGIINLTYIISAAYIILCAKRERLAGGSEAVLGMLDRKERMREEGAMPVKWLATTEDAEIEDVIKGFNPGSMHRIAVYDNDMRLKGVLEEDALLRATLTKARAGDMLS